MLTMPAGWERFTGGFVAARLLDQVLHRSVRRQMAWNLIGACLDLAAAGIALRDQTPPVVRPLPELAWQIGDYKYVYIDEMDDSALARTVEFGNSVRYGNIIVRPRHDQILLRACQSILRNRAPSIIAIDTLVNLRVLFSSGDFDWQHERVLRDLIVRYNQKVRSATNNDAIVVAL